MEKQPLYSAQNIDTGETIYIDSVKHLNELGFLACGVTNQMRGLTSHYKRFRFVRIRQQNCQPGVVRGAKLGQKQTDEHIAKRVPKLSKSWMVTMPDGSTINVTNLNEFAKKHGKTAMKMRKPAGDKGWFANEIQTTT